MDLMQLNAQLFADNQENVMQTFDFEITPIAECAETYKAAGATITGIHICARSIDSNASDVQMCRGNNFNQANYC